MASFQNNQISIIGNHKTVQKTNLERKYKISNQAALHLLCQHGKKIKYLQQWCSAEIWIPHTEDWKFDDHIERDVIIRGTTEEDVENTEKSLERLIKNMTGENMQRVILFQVVEFQGVIFTRLEYDQTVKSALTRASHIFMWKYPDSPGIQVQFLCSKAPPTHGFFHYVCLVCLSKKNSRTI